MSWVKLSKNKNRHVILRQEITLHMLSAACTHNKTTWSKERHHMMTYIEVQWSISKWPCVYSFQCCSTWSRPQKSNLVLSISENYWLTFKNKDFGSVNRTVKFIDSGLRVCILKNEIPNKKKVLFIGHRIFPKI